MDSSTGVYDFHLFIQGFSIRLSSSLAQHLKIIFTTWKEYYYDFKTIDCKSAQHLLCLFAVDALLQQAALRAKLQLGFRAGNYWNLSQGYGVIEKSRQNVRKTVQNHREGGEKWVNYIFCYQDVESHSWIILHHVLS